MPTWDATADFEEGDVTDFTAVNGTPTASVGSVKNGTYGCEMDIGTEYGNLDVAAIEDDTRITAECWFDPNTATIASLTDVVRIMSMIDGATTIVSVEIRNNAGTYQLRVGHTTDSAGLTYTSFAAISDAYQLLRCVWRASSGAGNNDGVCYLFVNNVLLASQTAIDNDTKVVDYVRFSAFTIAGTPSGVFYFDDCRIADECEFVGAPSGTLTSSGALTKKTKKPLAGTLSFVGIFSLLKSIPNRLHAPWKKTGLTAQQVDTSLTAPMIDTDLRGQHE